MTLFGSLIDSAPGNPIRDLRGICTSSGSLVLHAAILLSLVAGSYLHVAPLAEPTFSIQFQDVVGPPPPAPPPPPSGASRKIEEAGKPEIVPVEVPDVVQPQTLPDEIQEAEEGPGDSPVEGGVEGGVPDGIPGGVVDGVPGGAVGGFGGGDPGSVLEGLPGQDQPIYLVGDVRPPERTTFVKPEYPETARRVRAEGKVILEIVVGRMGDIESVKVLRSNPLFDEAAIEAVQKWKYQPALQGGRPVKVYLTVIVEFQLS